MPKPYKCADGTTIEHESDCDCGGWMKDVQNYFEWLTSSEDDSLPPWLDGEEELAKAAGCSTDVWQGMSPEEADNRLKKVCASRASKLQRVIHLMFALKHNYT